jgi:serine/threonine protein kinase
MRRQIGAGGMGEVWLAEHALLGRPAAIKLLHPSFSTHPDVVTRFFNEARAATAIADPGIVQIFDFGYDNGVAYIVMEMLDGETLEARRHRGGVNVGDALRIMRQVASSLGAAHERGIVHRDLKPDNIFLVRDPEVAGGERAKVLDFGIAKLTGDSTIKTQTSAVMGTPLYMSPEQCRGAGLVDARSDVYSLGCVLFTLLAGRTVFEAEGVGDLIVKHVTEPAPRLSSLVSVPPAVDNLVARCLEKDPARRFTSAGQLATALGALLTDAHVGAGGTARLTTTPPEATATTLSGSSAAVVSAAAPRASRKLMIGGVIGVLASASVVAVRISAAHDDEEQANSKGLTPTVMPATPVSADAIQSDDRPRRAVVDVRGALGAFDEWKATHTHDICPTPADLGLASEDPWGHPWLVTCVDQPADQVIGVSSAGPNGQLHDDDDVVSWRLGPDVTSLARGDRWRPASIPAHAVINRGHTANDKIVAHPQATATPIAAGAASAPPTQPVAIPNPEPKPPAAQPDVTIGSDGLIRHR